MFIERLLCKRTILGFGDIAVVKTDKNFLYQEVYIWDGVLNKRGSGECESNAEWRKE